MTKDVGGMQAPQAEEDAQRAARHADDGNTPLHPTLGGAFEEEDFPPLVPSSTAKERAHQVMTQLLDCSLRTVDQKGSDAPLSLNAVLTGT